MPCVFWCPSTHFKVGQAHPEGDVTRSRHGIKIQYIGFLSRPRDLVGNHLFYLFPYLVNAISSTTKQVVFKIAGAESSSLPFLICQCSFCNLCPVPTTVPATGMSHDVVTLREPQGRASMITLLRLYGIYKIPQLFWSVSFQRVAPGHLRHLCSKNSMEMKLSVLVLFVEKLLLKTLLRQFLKLIPYCFKSQTHI